MELGLSCQQLEQNIPALFTDPACGHVLRAKGFVQDENGWVELNATALRKPTARRVVGMVAGIVIIALGIALFKQSHLGNDSISALNMRLAELLGISLGTQNLCTNILFFLLEFWFGRKYIGLGTFVNGICIGYIVTAFYDPIHAHFGDAPSLAVQLAWGITAVGVVLLGASGGHTHSGLVGNLMIAGCALATSCYMVWFKKLIARYDVVTMLRWVYCLAALMVLPFGARELVHTDFAAMDTDILLATLFVVFVPTYVPNLLLNYSLKYVQPTVSSIYTYLQPVLAVVLSVAMGLDRLHLDTALCALVIFFGVGLVIRSYRGPAVPSAPLPVHTH